MCKRKEVGRVGILLVIVQLLYGSSAVSGNVGGEQVLREGSIVIENYDNQVKLVKLWYMRDGIDLDSFLKSLYGDVQVLYVKMGNVPFFVMVLNGKIAPYWIWKDGNSGRYRVWENRLRTLP
jgi:hypothetical protein